MLGGMASAAEGTARRRGLEGLREHHRERRPHGPRRVQLRLAAAEGHLAGRPARRQDGREEACRARRIGRSRVGPSSRRDMVRPLPAPPRHPAGGRRPGAWRAERTRWNSRSSRSASITVTGSACMRSGTESSTTRCGRTGPLVKAFESSWTAWNGLPSVATSSWTGAALAALEYFELRGKTVLCPSNTFMASPLTILAAGAKVEFVDCNRDDLCLSFADFERKVHAAQAGSRDGRPHRRAHRVRDRPDRRALPRRGDRPARGLRARARRLLERPQARDVRRRRPLVVRADEDDLDRRGRHARLPARRPDRVRADVPELRQAGLPDARAQLPDERVHGRARDPRRRAPRGDRRLEEPDRPQRARPAPSGPRSGFPTGWSPASTSTSSSSRIERSTGKVYDEPCHRVLGHAVDLPNTDWVAENHWCVPLYYRPAALPALQAVGQ